MSAIKEKKLLITPIKNGTSLDHLRPGTALKILGVLGHFGKASIAINVESKKLGLKDLLFIEGKTLSNQELDKIALIAEGGTLNLINDSIVVKKEKIQYPEFVSGIMKCLNPNCITNKELLETKFYITSKKPLKAKCFYCEARTEEKQIIDAIK